MDIDPRAFGKLEGKVEALASTLEGQNKTLEAQNTKMDTLNSKLDDINQKLSEARGGYKTLLLVGGASGTAVAGFNWLVHYIKG